MAGNDIQLELSSLKDFPAAMKGVLDVAIAGAMVNIATQIKADWQETIQRSGGKGGLNAWERDTYANSLKWEASAYSARIWSDWKLSDEVEAGRPERDMKMMLRTSTKVRQTKAGKRYLIIPFRHNVPGSNAHAQSMPKEVYAAAKELTKSHVTGMGLRRSASGHLVAQRTYLWGGKLPEGLAPKLQSKSDHYAGMVRMDTSSGKQKSSAYLTFRVMSEYSSGWIMPAKPGLFIVQGVVDRMRGAASQSLNDAILNIAHSA